MKALSLPSLVGSSILEYSTALVDHPLKNYAGLRTAVLLRERDHYTTQLFQSRAEFDAFNRVNQDRVATYFHGVNTLFFAMLSAHAATLYQDAQLPLHLEDFLDL